MKKTSKLFIVLTFILSLAFGMSTFAANNGNQTEATSALLSTIVSVAESIVASADMSVNVSGDESFVTSSVSGSVHAQGTINWKNSDEYLPYIQAALRENPNLQELDGHSIKVDENRTLIIDEESTSRSVDIPADFRYGYTWNAANESSWVEMAICNRIYFIPENYSGEILKIQNWVIEPSTGISKKTIVEVTKEPEKTTYNLEKYQIMYNFRLGELIKLLDLSNFINVDVYTSTLLPHRVKNGRILYYSGSLLSIFDTQTESFEVITTSCLDWKLSADENSILFTDWDRTEYSCEWAVNSNFSKTGNENVYYCHTSYSGSNVQEIQDLKNAIKQPDVVIYNTTTQELYCWNELYEDWQKIATDVQEFFYFRNVLYWMDSNKNAFLNKGFSGNILVGENVVGVNMSTDIPGFIVKPDSPLCDIEFSGCHIMYYSITELLN